MPNTTGKKCDFQCKDEFDLYHAAQWQLNSVLKKKYSFPVCRVLVKSLFTGVVESFRGIDIGVELGLLVPGA